MPNNNDKFNGWTTVINSVQTPLGFFTLIALILDGALIAAAALTKEVSMWVPLGILAFLIIMVFIIVMVRPLALYHPKDWPVRNIMTVNLIFPINAIEVDLDIPQCKLEVRDKEGQIKEKPSGTPNLTFGHGGWSFKLIEDVESSDSVRLELVEKNGRQWRVNPFPPFEKEAKVIEIN